MSKTPKHEKAAELVAEQVARERAWAHARWFERLSWVQIRQAANLPADEGGLGYDLSVQAIKGLVQQARSEAGDLTMGREERIERQLIEVDALARAARRDLDAAYARAATLDDAIAGYVVHDREDAEALASMAAERRQIARELESAQRRLDSAQERETKLAGLAAATELKVDVTTRDAVTEELNAMLERAGRKPVEAER